MSDSVKGASASFWIGQDPEVEGGFRITQAEPASTSRRHYKLPNRETAEHFLVSRGSDEIETTKLLDEVVAGGRSWLTVRVGDST